MHYDHDEDEDDDEDDDDDDRDDEDDPEEGVIDLKGTISTVAIFWFSDRVWI